MSFFFSAGIRGGAIPDSVVNHWPLDETDKQGATDNEGDSNGDLINDADITVDVEGPKSGESAYEFQPDGYIYIGSLSKSYDNFTITAWARNDSIDDSDYQNIFADSGGDEDVWIVNNNDGDDEFNSGDQNVTTSADEGDWKHYALVVDSDQLQGYVDGSLIGSESDAAGDFGDDVYIAAYSEDSDGPGDWTGRIADCYVFDSALTESEINDVKDSV